MTAIKRVFIDLGFPRKYSDSQIDRKAIPQMAKIVMGGFYTATGDLSKEYPMNGPGPSFNIRKATMADEIRLYEKTFEGWEI